MNSPELKRNANTPTTPPVITRPIRSLTATAAATLSRENAKSVSAMVNAVAAKDFAAASVGVGAVSAASSASLADCRKKWLKHSHSRYTAPAPINGRKFNTHCAARINTTRNSKANTSPRFKARCWAAGSGCLRAMAAKAIALSAERTISRPISTGKSSATSCHASAACSRGVRAELVDASMAPVVPAA